MFKNRFSLLCLAVASSLTLTACDVVDAAYDETLNDNAPEIVIAGGFKMISKVMQFRLRDMIIAL